MDDILVIVDKAHPVMPGGTLPDLKIVVTENDGIEPGALELNTETFERDAIALEEALYNVLPGGTYEQLLIKILQRQELQLIVPLGRS